MVIAKFIAALVPWVLVAAGLGLALLAGKIVLACQQVKTDLRRRRLRPLRVRWLPLPTLIFWRRSCRGATFHAVFANETGGVRQARCLVVHGFGPLEWTPDEPVSSEANA